MTINRCLRTPCQSSLSAMKSIISPRVLLRVASSGLVRSALPPAVRLSAPCVVTVPQRCFAAGKDDKFGSMSKLFGGSKGQAAPAAEEEEFEEGIELPSNEEIMENIRSSLKGELADEKGFSPKFDQDLNDYVTKDQKWKVVHTKGGGVIMTKKTDEGFECKVTFDSHGVIPNDDGGMGEEEMEGEAPPSDEEESVEDPIMGIEFSLEVSKPGRQSILFNLLSHPAQGLEIHSLQFVQPTTPLTTAAPEPYYQGPVIDELEPVLAQNLTDFVQGVCGIDADVTEWMIMEADRAEQKQYVQWLEGIHKLVAP